MLPAQTEPVTMEATQSAQAMTLHDVQVLALQRNRDVSRAILEVTKTEAGLRAVETTRYPSILGIAFIGQQVTQDTPQNLAVLPGIFQPVTQQYRLGMQVQQARLLVQIAKQQLRLAKQNAVAEVKKTYLRMVALKSAIKSREQNLAYLRTLVGYVDAEVRRGQALKVDLMVVQAKEATAEYELDRDSDELITAAQTLNQLLSRPLRAAIEVSDERGVLEPVGNNDNAATQAVARRPEIARVRFAAQRSLLESKVTLARYIPDISFGATGIFSRKLDITLPRSFVSIGFLGVWEPWDWGRRIDQAKVARREHSQSLIELSDISDKVSVEADNAQRVQKVVEKELRAAQLTMVSAEEQLRVADKRYRAGATLLKDVTEAQAAYSEAISQNVKAKADYATSQVEVDRAIGRDFD
jgi:outer membrane protein